MTAATDAQVRASAPGASSWVSANAGSGKTRVLTDRVARLLLAGTEPQRILCLTYTKAAAAEMQNRLFRTLGDWAMLDDEALLAALATLGEPVAAIEPARLARARTLFARALETPGGLKIQTIHAFCEALLRRFPLEAGVAPRFAVLEERQARALREEVLDTVAEAHPDEFAEVARRMPGYDVDPLLLELVHHRTGFAGPFDPGRLAAELGADPDLDEATLLAGVLPPDARTVLETLGPILAAGGSNDAKAGAKLAAALAAPEPERVSELLEDALLYGAGTSAPFTARTGHFPTRAVRRAHAGLMPALDALMLQVEQSRPLRIANAAFAKAAALNRFGRTWLAAFAQRKAAAGLLDFDDMIDRTEALLTRPGIAAWVLWRLDGGLDHILVDEAQDTSPAQWRVVGALSAEFFAGAGAREVERTIFVVGDEKQSIYSFQGADPAEFGERRDYYTGVLDGIGVELQRCDLLYSFRSASPILRLVDRVFAGPAGDGLAQPPAHHPIEPDRPGRVEFWPFLPKPDRPDEPPWDEPSPALAPEDPVAALATRVAQEISGWLASRRALPGDPDGRPIRAGDVMILVQRRNEIFDAIIRELKRARVPVAGADLLRIGGELAVNDLMAALRFAATAGDDLSLAALLRSPLGGLSERELFELAHPREHTLWQALAAQPYGRWADVRALLDDLRARADFLRPFELLSRILVRHGGRRRLVARLGPEAEDGIDALLDQALAYEGVEPPTLSGFIAWFDRDPIAVKRRTEETADQVRVMTVHGAKGLEAPIVILPDTGVRQDGRNAPQILRLKGGQPAWRVERAAAPRALADAEAARRGLVRLENRRLLYVALTRARTWLVVCGAGGDTGQGESWHGLVSAAMEELGARREPGDLLALDQGWTVAAATAGLAPAAAADDPPPARVPAAAAAASPVRASGLGGGHVLAGEPTGLLTEAEAMDRGTAVHRLLERLHGRATDDRPALAARLLPGHPAVGEILAEAAALLDDPALARLFGPGSLAEVEISAPLAELGGARLIGRIDRLVVGADEVLAVDFKSNQAVPADPRAVPEGILRQMGGYRAALAAIWPGRKVATAILWTRTGRLMPLPDALVGEALARAAAEAGGRA